ncbi:hypothetical protein D3C85_1532640 [compost metagenome]
MTEIYKGGRGARAEERNAQVVEDRKTMTVAEVMAKHGISKARVHQILKRAKAEAMA